ncbi:hypothetical protein MHYP_G00287140 [Metynnis hypsauchen]
MAVCLVSVPSVNSLTKCPVQGWIPEDKPLLFDFQKCPGERSHCQHVQHQKVRVTSLFVLVLVVLRVRRRKRWHEPLGRAFGKANAADLK